MTIEVEYFIVFHPEITRFFIGGGEFVRDYHDEIHRIPILLNGSPPPQSARRYFHSQKILEEIRRHANKVSA